MGLRFLTAGESHGAALVAILDGIPAGLSLSVEVINHDLARRQRGFGAGPRMKIEQDRVQILSGLMSGVTIGAPLALLVENRDHARWRGQPIPPFTVPRPGHADLTGAIKFGFTDLRPALERASARETTARVAVGAVCRQFLAEYRIQVGGYVTDIGEVTSDLSEIPLGKRPFLAEASDVRCPHPKYANLMRAGIQQAIKERETLGGIIEVVVEGLPAGLGSYTQWDRRLESRLGAAILSIQAIKGVEIGHAFENTRRPGSQAQDAIRLNAADPEELTAEGDIIRTSGLSGGLEGGITTGQPLVIRAAMKPIASTLNPQQSVDLASGAETSTQYERSDFCPVPRAVVVVEAMAAFVLADALIEKIGGDSLEEMKPRFETLRRARISDLVMDNHKHIWWPE
ncbi:MAG TPA: chorismate synthase [Anaerolineales bacterium]|nr:chorismate synthase [Anaerolineales bacterium]